MLAPKLNNNNDNSTSLGLWIFSKQEVQLCSNLPSQSLKQLKVSRCGNLQLMKTVKQAPSTPEEKLLCHR